MKAIHKLSGWGSKVAGVVLTAKGLGTLALVAVAFVAAHKRLADAISSMWPTGWFLVVALFLLAAIAGCIALYDRELNLADDLKAAEDELANLRTENQTLVSNADPARRSADELSRETILPVLREVVDDPFSKAHFDIAWSRSREHLADRLLETVDGILPFETPNREAARADLIVAARAFVGLLNRVGADSTNVGMREVTHGKIAIADHTRLGAISQLIGAADGLDTRAAKLLSLLDER